VFTCNLHSPHSDLTASEPAYERQLEAYLKEPRVPRSTNIYAYWHCSQFPDLEEAAHKYLSAPPTSVASEQLFSSAGQRYADRRSSLLGENAEKLLFWPIIFACLISAIEPCQDF
jgi:hypothetical protein